MTRPGTSPVPLPDEPLPGQTPPYVPPVQPGSNAPQDLSHVHPHIGLYIETGRRTREFAPAEEFDWHNITRAIDGGDTTATLAALPDSEQIASSGNIGHGHVVHLLEKVHPDCRIRIAHSTGMDRAVLYFQGYPMAPSIHWSDRLQQVSCVCLSEGQEVLRTEEAAQIIGRRMRYDPLAEWEPDAPDDREVGALPCHFNARNRPNRSGQPYAFWGYWGREYQVHLFTGDDAPDAGWWSYADALRYILYHHVMRYQLDVSVVALMQDTEPLAGAGPAPYHADPLVARLTGRVEDLVVNSVNVEEAVALLTGAAGLHYEVALRNAAGGSAIVALHYLRVFAALAGPQDAVATPVRAMVSPKGLDLPCEPPYTPDYDRSDQSIALAQRGVQATFVLDRRAINAPIILGGTEEYEVTLLLRPGWSPFAYLDDVLIEPEDPGAPEDRSKQEAAREFWDLQFNLPHVDQATGVPHSVYHGAHPDHHTVQTIGRLWIFPDDCSYVSALTEGGESVYARQGWGTELYSPYDPGSYEALVLVRNDIGGGISEATDWVPRRRPFRELIGRARESSDRAPIVRINFTATDAYSALASEGWITYGGQVHIDEKRGAIYILENDIWQGRPLLADPMEPGGMSLLSAYIGDMPLGGWGVPHAFVSVTCVLRGDRRMINRPTITGGSFVRRRYSIMDNGYTRFRYRNRRGQQSHLDAQETDPDPAYETRNDTEAMEVAATREGHLVAGDNVAGSFETFWIDTSYCPGDSITGVQGLGVSFGRWPEIVGIEYVKDASAGYRTVVHLADLRDAPEVGVE